MSEELRILNKQLKKLKAKYNYALNKEIDSIGDDEKQRKYIRLQMSLRKEMDILKRQILIEEKKLDEEKLINRFYEDFKKSVEKHTLPDGFTIMKYVEEDMKNIHNYYGFYAFIRRLLNLGYIAIREKQKGLLGTRLSRNDYFGDIDYSIWKLVFLRNNCTR